MVELTAEDRRAASLLGALVADAASLGLHWIYAVDRIAQVADAVGSAAFVPIDPAHFDGVPAYFAHGTRADGDLTQYGEMLWLAIRALGANGGAFDREGVQAAFTCTFGPGGSYAGYIDRPTRGALDNIAREQVDPSGVDDDQLPAVARLPALVAGAQAPVPVDLVGQMIRITNVNAVAEAHGLVFVRLLEDVIGAAAMGDALARAAQNAPDGIRTVLEAALDTSENDSVAYGEITQRACHLPMGMPLAFHIMARSSSFAEAVERNIRAGGDSAGRAIVIGSVMAALTGQGGIPLDWVLKLRCAQSLWSDCRDLVRAGAA